MFQIFFVDSVWCSFVLSGVRCLAQDGRLIRRPPFCYHLVLGASGDLAKKKVSVVFRPNCGIRRG